MRIALAQINPHVANFESNTQKIIDNITTLAEKRAELIVFPEAALFGYHPFDLLEREQLVLEQEKYLKKIIKSIPKNVHVL
ncbi:MAG: nitrilase-related carbon-nitrogen hydrolase, partial [Pseudobdellovibrio sp.]